MTRQLQTKQEYYADIAAKRAEADRLDKQPVGSPAQAREVAKKIVELRREADLKERAAYTDQTVKAEWQMAERQREDQLQAKRFQNVMALDKKVNPHMHIGHAELYDALANSVDLLSGLSDPAKVGLISQLLSGAGVPDNEGNRYIMSLDVRATLHTDEGGSYVSFVKADNGSTGLDSADDNYLTSQNARGLFDSED